MFSRTETPSVPMKKVLLAAIAILGTIVVANDVSATGVGFQHDTNAVCLLRPDATMVTISLTDKRFIARAVLDAVVEIRNRAT